MSEKCEGCSNSAETRDNCGTPLCAACVCMLNDEAGEDRGHLRLVYSADGEED